MSSFSGYGNRLILPTFHKTIIFIVNFFLQTREKISLFFFSVITTTVAATNSALFKIRENYFRPVENTIWEGKTASPLSCSQRCAIQLGCGSANFLVNTKRCLLSAENKESLSSALLHQKDSFYLEKVCPLCRRMKWSVPRCYKNFHQLATVLWFWQKVMLFQSFNWVFYDRTIRNFLGKAHVSRVNRGDQKTFPYK